MPHRTPHADNDLIDRLAEGGISSQAGSAGGNVARGVGKRAEINEALAGDREVERVHKSDEGKRKPRRKIERQ